MKPEFTLEESRTWLRGFASAAHSGLRGGPEVAASLLVHIEELENALGAFLEAAESWHQDTGHDDGDPIIHCDAICEAMPAARAVLGREPGEKGESAT